jgi:hypothetical protein
MMGWVVVRRGVLEFFEGEMCFITEIALWVEITYDYVY